MQGSRDRVLFERGDAKIVRYLLPGKAADYHKGYSYCRYLDVHNTAVSKLVVDPANTDFIAYVQLPYVSLSQMSRVQVMFAIPYVQLQFLCTLVYVFHA